MNFTIFVVKSGKPETLQIRYYRSRKTMEVVLGKNIETRKGFRLTDSSSGLFPMIFFSPEFDFKVKIDGYDEKQGFLVMIDNVRFEALEYLAPGRNLNDENR